MTTIPSILLFVIFLSLSSIHFYWGFGGSLGKSAAIPTNSNGIGVLQPGVLATLIVAFGLLGFGVFILIKGGLIVFILPNWVSVYGLWLAAGIFAARAIGDFRYVGFFKKIRQTKFGEMDTKYYSPLCLIIATLMIVMALS